MTSSLPKTMKAAQYHPETNTIGLEEIPVPKPSEEDLLIKTIAASLCHSDLVRSQALTYDELLDALQLGKP